MKNKQKSNHKYITSFLKKLHTENSYIEMIISSCKVSRGLTVVLVAIPHLGSAVFLCLTLLGVFQTGAPIRWSIGTLLLSQLLLSTFKEQSGIFGSWFGFLHQMIDKGLFYTIFWRTKFNFLTNLLWIQELWEQLGNHRTILGHDSVTLFLECCGEEVTDLVEECLYSLDRLVLLQCLVQVIQDHLAHLTLLIPQPQTSHLTRDGKKPDGVYISFLLFAWAQV